MAEIKSVLTRADALNRYIVLKYFKFDHLPKHLQEISEPFCELAYACAIILPHNAETTTALRKLLEAKDCAVRAIL